MEVFRLIEASDLAQSGTLSLQALFDFVIFFDLDKIGRHYLPPAWDFENVCWMKWATGRPPGSGWQGYSLRRELEVAPKREQAGETSRRIRNSFELGKECRGCAPGRCVKDELPRAGNSELRLRSRAGRPKSILYDVRASRTAQLPITQSCRLRLGIHGQPASEPS